MILLKKRDHNNLYFGIDFFNHSCRWIETKQGYEFWFERQLELCFILCKYDVKNKDNKTRFNTYLCFTPPFDYTNFMEIKEKYRLLYNMLYNKI